MAVWTALTLALWIGGLILLAWSPVIGCFMLAGGAASAGKAYDTPDDMETFWGMLFGLMLTVGALAALLAAWSRWTR